MLHLIYSNAQINTYEGENNSDVISICISKFSEADYEGQLTKIPCQSIYF